MDIWGRITLWLVGRGGGCHMHCRIMSSISELHSRDASNNCPPPSCDNQKYLQALPSIAPPPRAFQGLTRTAPQERPLLHPCGACVLVCTSALSHSCPLQDLIASDRAADTRLGSRALSALPCPPLPSVRGGGSEPGGGGHLLALLQAAALARRSMVSGYTRAGPGRKDGARSVEREALQDALVSWHQ